MSIQPLKNEVLGTVGITNEFLYPRHSKIMKENLDIANTFCQSLGRAISFRLDCQRVHVAFSRSCTV